MRFHREDQYINSTGDTIDILAVDEGDIITYKMPSGSCFKSARFFTEKMLIDGGYAKVAKENNEEDI